MMFNQLKTLLLLGTLSAVLVGIGAAIGPSWMIGGLALAVILNLGGYFFSDRIVLRMHGAVELDKQDYSELHTITAELAERAGIPKPRLYLIPAHYPNAFATGRNPRHGVVAITEGLIQLLTARELRGVIAHEIAHIRNRDVLIATVAAMLAAAITYVANFLSFSSLLGSVDEEDAPSPLASLVFAMMAPLGAGLIQMAISRSREYIADEFAAKISGDPQALASALGKLSGASATVYEEPSAAVASLFIVNPLHGSVANLFSTHPPADERVRKLLALACANGANKRQFEQAWGLQARLSPKKPQRI